MDLQKFITEWNTELGFIAALIAILTLLWTIINFGIKKYRTYKEPVDVLKFLKALNIRNNYKIAIVDDELDSFPVKYLKSLGYEVSTYETISLDDVDRLLSFDIIFLDVKGVVKEDLDTGGAKLLKLVKRKKPSVMVVAVSSGKYQLHLNSFFENSDDVLNKPIDEPTIEQTISHLINNHLNIENLAEQLSDMVVCAKSKQEKTINKNLIRYFAGKINQDDMRDSIHSNTSHKYSEKISSLAIKIMKRINFDS